MIIILVDLWDGTRTSRENERIRRKTQRTYFVSLVEYVPLEGREN
jgi:hypothetical protein